MKPAKMSLNNDPVVREIILMAKDLEGEWFVEMQQTIMAEHLKEVKDAIRSYAF